MFPVGLLGSAGRSLQLQVIENLLILTKGELRMKKALSFAVALGLVAGMASSAMAADLVLSGDARLRGVYKQNTIS